MEKFKVGDKVKTKFGIGKVAGLGSGYPPILVRLKDWKGGHDGRHIAMIEGKPGVRGSSNYWFFSVEELELVSPIPIGANPPEEKSWPRKKLEAAAAGKEYSASGELVDLPKRENVLEEAVRVTSGDRRRDYGSAKTNHDRIALLWNVWDIIANGSDEAIAQATANIKVQCAAVQKSGDGARDVAMKMILLKIAREANTPKHDNLVDICGYARCLQEINDL